MKNIMCNYRKKISIIIPAQNENGRLEKALDNLQMIKLEEYPNLEIIVSVNGPSKSTRKDASIARKYGAIVAKSERGPSKARNKGASIASGEILIFMDADVRPSLGTISTIARSVDENTIGTCTAYPNSNNLKARMVAFLKNFLRSTGIIKGMSELVFCHRTLFHERGIKFNPSMNLGEIHDFIYRARKKAGAKYKYLRIKRGWEFSVDRYERVGYLKVFSFWIRWWFFTQILKKDPKPFEREYWGMK